MHQETEDKLRVFSQHQDILNNWPMVKPPSMTFILGSRCTDGVVLVADRKITSINEVGSTTFDYKQKIFGILHHVVFGSSGSTDTFELFRDHIIDLLMGFLRTR